ncbi:MAG: type I-E CRISPR-associated protein Cas6/Cse3/CasE [Gammaproteobacteria bacterium]|nr:type I-E CRISPR-associated protein Cas6/Cse3/CasE [Gammaproteobacteria bacterium]
MNYFSRVILNTDNINSQNLAKMLCADGYREHQSLWRLFSGNSDAKRDFLFRRESVNNALRYFVVSNRPPQDNEGVWEIASKDYDPNLVVGQKLAFNLRVNPVVTRKDENGNGKRHDVVMDAKVLIGYKNIPTAEREPLAKIIHTAGVAWLQTRAEKNGFKINESMIQINGYQQHQGFKRGGKFAIRYSTLDFSGILEVSDPSKFVNALYNGIGPAKAFGCGLLLVRRL